MTNEASRLLLSLMLKHMGKEKFDQFLARAAETGVLKIEVPELTPEDTHAEWRQLND